MLDVGCGHGKFSSFWSRKNHMIGVDFALGMLKLAYQNGLEVYHADATALPFGESQFDIVLSAEVAQHFSDVGPLFSEMARVVRTGGLIVASTANAGSVARKMYRRILRPWVRGRTEWPLPILHSWDSLKESLSTLPLALERIVLLYFPSSIHTHREHINRLDRIFASNFVLRLRKC